MAIQQNNKKTLHLHLTLYIEINSEKVNYVSIKNKIIKVLTETTRNSCYNPVVKRTLLIKTVNPNAINERFID